MIESLKVTWVPAHPSEGWQSMNRYWRSLERAAESSQHRSEMSFAGLLGNCPKQSKRAPRIQRMFSKYLIYPLICELSRKEGIIHLLDHSYAHLLKHFPASAKKIVTLHDLAPLRVDTLLSARQVDRFKRVCLELHRADLVLCASKTTYDDAREVLDLPIPKLRVLSMGVDYDFFCQGAECDPIQSNSFAILSVGTVAPRKNLQILPKIFSHLKKAGIEATLWRVGASLPPILRDQILDIVGNSKLIEYGAVSDARLAQLYQQAGVFIMPSTFEGFGLPVLEAMSAGCPVVASNGTSLREVAGDAALLFDPFDDELAARHIISIVENNVLRDDLVAAGRMRAKDFSWDSHLTKLVEIYRGL